ncbi:hypothetical protein [Streptomyces vilmorinianum]|uniref:hypothetical protein n=1 Tax=Streptomyces vilmorinianum TaxID=3051092 RepID=UPI0010FB45FA|nr:hypothetical protein [Streptomyces vilmorinianum]
MLTETTGRTPQDLAAELANMRAVDDWPSVWSGPPQGGSGEFDEWCGRYGWEPQTFDRQLEVLTPSGGHWTFYDRLGGEWSPVESLTHYAWQVRADSPAENSAVLATAAEIWPTHLEAAASVLGAPTWSGSWDAADFPEPPHPSYWQGREARMRSRRPYEFAYWAPGGDVPGQPYIVLSQSVTFPTWTSTMAGGSAIALDVYAPGEFREARR